MDGQLWHCTVLSIVFRGEFWLAHLWVIQYGLQEGTHSLLLSTAETQTLCQGRSRKQFFRWSSARKRWCSLGCVVILVRFAHSVLQMSMKKWFVSPTSISHEPGKCLLVPLADFVLTRSLGSEPPCCSDSTAVLWWWLASEVNTLSGFYFLFFWKSASMPPCWWLAILVPWFCFFSFNIVTECVLLRW